MRSTITDELVLKMLAPLSAYLDESSDKEGRILAIGGFVGRADEWSGLLSEWIERLKPKNLPAPIKAFHMTDCETGGGEFRDELGWDRESRKQLIIDLLRLIGNFEIVMLGVSLRIKDYAALKPLGGDRFAHSNYHLLLQTVMFDISEQLEIDKTPRWESVAYFFDRNARHEYWANKIHKELQNDPRLKWRHRIGSLTFDSKERLRMLQVADIGAYEAMKYITNVEFSEGRTRKSFEALESTKSVWRIYTWEGEKLQQMADLKRTELAEFSKKK